MISHDYFKNQSRKKYYAWIGSWIHIHQLRKLIESKSKSLWSDLIKRNNIRPNQLQITNINKINDLCKYLMMKQ